MFSRNCAQDSCGCLWSGVDRFCRMLEKGTVPLDRKWPFLILQLRDAGNSPFLNDAQKVRMHNILREVLQKKDFSEEQYVQSITEINAVMQVPYEAKMSAISYETQQLLEEIKHMMGSRQKEIVAAAHSMEENFTDGKDTAAILADIRSSLRDVAEKMEQDAVTLKKISLNDSLTGLGNRRDFDANLQAAVSGYCKCGEPVALIMFDIDHFKAFNDTYGHLVGDQVLSVLGDRIRRIVAVLAKSDGSVHAARYGGEEFTILLCGQVVNKAKNIAETVRSSIESAVLLLRDAEGRVLENGLHVTVSVGVAELCRAWKEEPQIKLVDAADKALYYAKRNGRNKAVCYDPNAKQQYNVVKKK